jgi:hypothetical protein
VRWCTSDSATPVERLPGSLLVFSRKRLETENLGVILRFPVYQRRSRSPPPLLWTPRKECRSVSGPSYRS